MVWVQTSSQPLEWALRAAQQQWEEALLEVAQWVVQVDLKEQRVQEPLQEGVSEEVEEVELLQS